MRQAAAKVMVLSCAVWLGYLTDEHIAFALYAHGPYQRRTLAVIVRLIEKANDHFDSYPGLLELLN